jgi:hypothetical protein
MKALKDSEEVEEVEVDTKEDRLVEEEHFGDTTMMNMDTL